MNEKCVKICLPNRAREKCFAVAFSLQTGFIQLNEPCSFKKSAHYSRQIFFFLTEVRDKLFFSTKSPPTPRR